MRLIDADALRNELYDADAITMRGVAIINRFPTIDAVAVVRCAECKHRALAGKAPLVYYCTFDKGLASSVRETDFCSYGERRSE